MQLGIHTENVLLVSGIQGGYVHTTTVPLLRADTKTITLNLSGSEIILTRAFTAEELALFLIKKTKVGFYLYCSNVDVVNAVANKTIRISFTVS